MPGKTEVMGSLEKMRAEVVALVENASPDAWSSETYEDGWMAKDVLAHIASTCGPAGYLLMLAKLPPGSPAAAFDGEAFNRQQTALRAGHTPQQILDEVRATVQRDIQAVEGAPEALLQQHMAAPWGSEGTVAELIILAVEGHLGGHIADLRGAIGS